MKTILLAGASGAGKTTLARALCHQDQRHVLSTSAYLRNIAGDAPSDELYERGQALDADDGTWLRRLVADPVWDVPAVVDAVRSATQDGQLGHDGFVRVNVTCDDTDLSLRWLERGASPPRYQPYLFPSPDFTWNSSRVSLSTAVAVIAQLSGSGSVDLLFGGQFGSEGKGKLAALLAPGYNILVRSGGPNAGHWVRDRGYEFCFHHIPSGALANRQATIAIAAGATIGPGFYDEVVQTNTSGRLWVDRNAVIIEDSDREAEGKLVDLVGSTAQGVGSATSRRILRGLRGTPVRTAEDLSVTEHCWKSWTRDVSTLVNRAIDNGSRVMIEGTQGSALSIFHGEYPFTTSRDTNIPGLLSETGIAPCHVRDTWMVVRSYPIRVGGNSGPLYRETDWATIAERCGKEELLLKSREHTSTTNRLRRVGELDRAQLHQAVAIKRPTRLFLSFADYLTKQDISGCREWGKLPDEVLRFVGDLENEFKVPVGGVSTGRTQEEVVMRKGFVR